MLALTVFLLESESPGMMLTLSHASITGPAGEQLEDEHSEGPAGGPDDDDLLAAAVAAVEAEEATGKKVKNLFRKRKPPAAPSALQIPTLVSKKPPKTHLVVEPGGHRLQQARLEMSRTGWHAVHLAPPCEQLAVGSCMQRQDSEVVPARAAPVVSRC